MRVRMSIKKICEYCFFQRRKNNKLYVMCKINPRHRQRQRFSTMMKEGLLTPTYFSPLLVPERAAIGERVAQMLAELLEF